MQRIISNFRLIGNLLLRYTIVWSADTVSVAVTALALPGIHIDRSGALWYLTPLFVALAFGLLNALLRPVLIILLLPITFVTLGLATLLLNAGLFYLMDLIVPAFTIDGFGSAVIGVLLLTLINTLLGNLFRVGDDYSFYATMMAKFSSLTRPREVDELDRGVVVFQIDGLAYETLKHGLRNGRMPFLSDMIKRRHFAIRKWFSGLPCGTSAVQASFFYGSSYDIPGFRWYDKSQARMIVSSNSSDMSQLDERFDSVESPLLENGTCINALIHGHAKKRILTISALSDKDLKHHRGSLEDFAIFSLHPYLYTRTILFMLWDFLVDRFQNYLDMVSRRKPVLRRSIKSSFLRAVGNALFREATTHFVIEDIVRGMPIIYANYLGYDLVAHYAGPRSWDAMSTLTSIDRQIKKIMRAMERRTGKHYDLVVLSDHGQTKCVAFSTLYGKSLADVIEEHLQKPLIEQLGETAEFGYFNALLREIQRVEEAYGTRSIKQSRRTLERLRARLAEEVGDKRDIEHPVIVCVNGNLAHIYFTEVNRKLTTEELIERHPRFLEFLVGHPGIGFIVTENSEGEHLLMGKEGMRRLAAGIVEGEDPLAAFVHKWGPSREVLAKELRRLAAFPRSGDIVVNGAMMDGGVISFEKQRGTHGGVGGPQTEPFIIYSRRFRRREDRVRDAVEVHAFLKGLTP